LDQNNFLARILIPVDDSISSLMAQETAALIARKTGSTVTVLHVTPDFSSSFDHSQSVGNELFNSVEQSSEALLNKSKALFGEENISAELVTFRGDPATTILDFSARDYDLTVIGGCGENETDLCSLGNVAKKVARQARSPVLIVKKVSLLSSFLVCTDGSEHSIQAMIFSAKLAKKLNAKVTLFNVQEKPMEPNSEIAEQTGEGILTATINAIGKNDLEIAKKVEFGTPSNVIIDVAEEGKYDVIVLGSRGLGAAERALLGSVSDDISNNSKCSILIVPLRT
jgi:nucleotide-binding universal stress UspA family protein